jgi:hypothetical protein
MLGFKGNVMKKYIFILSLLLIHCDTNYQFPEIVCAENNLIATHTMTQVLEMAGYGITTFENEITVMGYVTSSDVSGNIYKTLSLQDAPENAEAAIQFSMDKTNLYTVYPIGRKVFVKLKGLSIGYGRGVLQIGKAIAGELERIPSSEVFNHFFRSCEVEKMEAKAIKISEINESHLQSLVVFENVQFAEENMGEFFGDISSTKTKEILLHQTTENCDQLGTIKLNISGFSDFKNKILPEGNGNVQGVLTKYYSEYQLQIRDENDVQLANQRCSIVNSVQATSSYQEIIDLYAGALLEFGLEKKYVFEGYVVSSDQEGNFENVLYIQDKPENSEGGFKILMDEEAIFEKYALGDKVFLELNYLYLDKIDGQFTIGVFEDASIGAIEGEAISRYLFNSHENYEITPEAKNLAELSLDKNQNTLVTVSELQLKKSELGKAYAYYSGEEKAARKLVLCEESNVLELETLGSAAFSNKKFPTNKGSVTGVLYRDQKQLKIQIRSLEDVDFDQSYEECAEVIENILITEVADPENSVGARFVELYNAGTTSVSLIGWRLNKYLNGSNSLSSGELDLSGYSIESGGFLIIANTGFNTLFNEQADVVSSYISGNGDDVYELEDSEGSVHDVYGVKGEDGSNMIWEYLDGKAIRKKEVNSSASIFDATEWIIYSKTHGNKQTAPQDFSPNSW